MCRLLYIPQLPEVVKAKELQYQFNAIDLLPLALGRSKRKIYSGSLDLSDVPEIIK
jgi:hypothetical protein